MDEREQESIKRKPEDLECTINKIIDTISKRNLILTAEEEALILNLRNVISKLTYSILFTEKDYYPYWKQVQEILKTNLTMDKLWHYEILSIFYDRSVLQLLTRRLYKFNCPSEDILKEFGFNSAGDFWHYNYTFYEECHNELIINVPKNDYNKMKIAISNYSTFKNHSLYALRDTFFADDGKGKFAKKLLCEKLVELIEKKIFIF